MKFLRNEELNRPAAEDYLLSAKLPVTVVLDNVRSGLNVGSVFRSSDGFLVERIFLCGITAQPPDREILKTALGATETVPWKYFTNTGEALDELTGEGYQIIAVEQADKSESLEVAPIDCGRKYALVFGHEVKGVDEALVPLLHRAIEVPQSGTKHSLNIAVCAGIVLWKFYEALYLKRQ